MLAVKKNGFQGCDFNFVPIRVVKVVNIGRMHFFRPLQVVTFFIREELGI